MSGDATYVAPASVADAVAALADGGTVVAGGTDLVVGARQRGTALPSALVAIHAIDELRRISSAPDGTRLGALVSHETLVDDETIRERYTALADAAAVVGSPATRWTGTIGGNVMNASPAADTVGPLIGFDAVATLVSGDGTREVAVAELATGPGRTSAEPGELLTALSLSVPPAGSGSCYARLEFRRQMEIAVVGATAVIGIEDGRVAHARVAITALAPTIRRVPAAEARLIGSAPDRAAAAEAAAAAAEASEPIDDVRAPADYRRAMAAVLCRRVIMAAIARAEGEHVTIPASGSLVGAT